MPEEHARVSPSSGGTWGPCPGSIQACERIHTFEEPESQAALEGSTAHWLAEQCLLTGAEPEAYFGTFSPQKIAIDAEMITHVKPYLADVRRFIGPGDVYVEGRVQTSYHVDCWGTPDAVHINRKMKILVIWDFKYGWVPVEVQENSQLICYADGVFNTYLPEEPREKWTVILVVAQPRPYHTNGGLRSWQTSGDELQPRWATQAQSVKDALSERPPMRSGPHCKYCKAQTACPAALRVGNNLFDLRDWLPPDLPGLSVEDLGRYLNEFSQAEQVLKGRIRALHRELTARLKKGERSTAWTLTPVSGNLDWSVSMEDVESLGSLLGVEVSHKKLLTPTQVKDLGVPLDVLGPYTQRKTSVKLVPIDNKRAEDIFND